VRSEKIVLDTNVLISAFGWRGPPRRVFELVLDGELELVISGRQLVELERVLAYERLGFSHEQRKRFLAIVLESATVVETSGKLKVIREDPDDDIILETAVEHGVQ
jgi:putative PIN family toxin of toxin-antitoxin system